MPPKILCTNRVYTFGEHLGATGWPNAPNTNDGATNQNESSPTASGAFPPEYDEMGNLKALDEDIMQTIWSNSLASPEPSSSEPQDKRLLGNSSSCSDSGEESSGSSTSSNYSSSSSAFERNAPFVIKKICAGFTASIFISNHGECSILSNQNSHLDTSPKTLQYINQHYFIDSASCGYRHAILVASIRSEESKEDTVKRHRRKRLNSPTTTTTTASATRRPTTPSRRSATSSSSRKAALSSDHTSRTKRVPSRSHNLLSSLTQSDTVRRLFRDSKRYRTSGTNLVKLKQESRQKKQKKSKYVIIGVGSNELHQLGFSVKPLEQSNNCYIVDLPPLRESLSLMQVSCGYYHTLFLFSDHSIWSCGTPILEVYQKTQSQGYLKFEVFSEGKTLALRSIAAGSSHNIAVAMNGSVWCWGQNRHGQCGLGHRKSVPVPTRVKHLEGYHIVEASAGYFHSVFLSSEGEVFTCGDASYGRLGRSSRRSRPIKVRFGIPNQPSLNGEKQQTTTSAASPSTDDSGEAPRATSISAGGYHTLVSFRDGSAYAMGHSGFGQCGVSRGETKCYFQPQRIGTSNHEFIGAVSAGGYHSVLLQQDTSYSRSSNRFFRMLQKSYQEEQFSDMDIHIGCVL